MDGNQAKIARGFDRLSWVYDAIVKLVFGSELDRLQQDALKSIHSASRILIIGGGSGTLLPYLLEHIGPEQIHYAELSENMRSLAAGRLNEIQKQRMLFYSDLSEIPKSVNFDLILLPFVLDCYSESNITSMLKDCQARMNPQASLIITDFSSEIASGYQPSWLKSAFIHLLYTFFRWTTAIEAKRLAPFDALTMAAGFSQASKISRYKGWVQSTQWRIPNSDQRMA